MARKTQNTRKTTASGPKGPALMTRLVTGGAVWRLVKVTLVAGAIIAVGLSMRTLERRVLFGDAVVVEGLEVRLIDPPKWMPATLRENIRASLMPDGSAARTNLTEAVHARAEANPWIRSVERVWRRPTTSRKTCVLEVRATYRRPLARVQTNRGYTFVSADGVRLPTGQVPRYRAVVRLSGGRTRTEYYLRDTDAPAHIQPRPLAYISIYGALASAPDVGQPWAGRDIADGIRLVRLIASRPYANQITMMDVRNHGGRVDPRAPHLRMWAQVGRSRATDIRFGQFPRHEGDHVVSPDRKLSQLDEFVTRNGGRLAGTKAYLDLRYDHLHASVN